MMRLLLLAATVAVAAAHGSLFIPAPRNSQDNRLPQYENGKSPATACTCTNGNGNQKDGCDRGLRAKADGQACLWWSQGCSIGCAKCATNAEGPDSPGPFGGHGAQAGKIGFSTRYCNATHNSEKSSTNPIPLINSTLPTEAWTLNIGATEGSEEDAYRYNPWRAPGYAPVVDPCGQAGGEYKGQGIGGDSVFTTTNLSTMGDMGSALPASPLRPRWVAGSQVEVAWGPRYNHGGGYQYRLCKADDPMGLTEECFQKTPLEFDRTKQMLVWNTKEVPVKDEDKSKVPAIPANGTLRIPVPEPVFVDVGTWPHGSTWARDPIPRIQDGRMGLHKHNASQGGPACADAKTGRAGGIGCYAFKPPCDFDTGMLPCPKGEHCDGDGMGACSSDWVVGLISDEVLIPKTLAPGAWVLSWRWDCEETAQIWQNCADVEVVAAQ